MVALVESMLALHKQVITARLPQEKEMLQRQIQATDEQIDRLVYELYGLTIDSGVTYLYTKSTGPPLT